jgi:small subunit ribosomal protein S16
VVCHGPVARKRNANLFGISISNKASCISRKGKNMALKIRLARGGAKKRPFYRIVVAEASSPRDGRFVERIGSYNPMLPSGHDDRLVLDGERAKYWMSKGAKPTLRVHKMMAGIGLLDSPEIREQPKKSAPGQKRLDREEAAAEAAATAAEAAAEAAPATEAPAEEAPAAEAPAEEVAAEAAPAEEAPAEEAPAEEAPAEEAPAEEAPAEEAPAEEAPAEEAPAEEAPAEEATAEEAPAEAEEKAE